MANASILAAFERMWEHIVNALGNKANVSHTHSASEITSGVLPIAKGGTGATTPEGARANLGISTAECPNINKDMRSFTITGTLPRAENYIGVDCSNITADSDNTLKIQPNMYLRRIDVVWTSGYNHYTLPTIINGNSMYATYNTNSKIFKIHNETSEDYSSDSFTATLWFYM